MNDQLLLYSNLMLLVNTNDAFYYQDFSLDESTYRIFNYRLASYTDFLAPSAIECRGITFEVTPEGQYIRLASRPMQKFWNRFENPATMELDLSTIESISNKADGSLISTILHDGELRLKSKGSLFSDQALSAMRLLDTDRALKVALYVYALRGYTTNLEFVSPKNRIVLGYLEPKLIVLNIRNNTTGEYVNIEPDDFLYQYMDPPVDTKGLSLEEFVNQIPDMLDDIEGYVIKLKSGLWFKQKTKKYQSLHFCKNSVNNPRRLWEVIVNEGIDDVRSMFHDDALLIKQIDEMQAKVDHIYNSMINLVETFYNSNKHLERKDYAIKGQNELPKLYFSLAMNLYLDKPNNYKEFLVKQYKSFGIKEDVKEE